MTYDITFIRRCPGLTLLETLEERNANFDEKPPPMKLTATQ